MKEGWTYKKLGELALSMADGPFGSNLKKEHYTESKEVRIIQLSNIGEDGWRDENTKYTTYEHLETIKRSEVLPGDIVIAKMMPAGRAIICPNNDLKYVLSSDAVRVTLKEGLNNRFILFSINSPYFRKQVYENVSGSGRVRTSLTKLRDCKIYLPSLPEQQSIVDYLDSAFAKIDAMKANAEKALNEAKALFQASLKEMLEPKEGWEEKKLGEMSEIQSGFAFKSTQFQKKGEFQVIRMGNVRPGIIRYNESPVFIDSVDENTIEKALLKVGDMIITQTGSRNKRDYGFTVLIDKENLLLNQRIARIRVVNTITNNYLLYYSWTDYFRDQYFANEGGTVGQGNVGIDAIRYAVISYPPLSEQQSIVETLDSLKSKVDRLQENYDKISQECDALKQAILRQVFE